MLRGSERVWLCQAATPHLLPPGRCHLGRPWRGGSAEQACAALLFLDLKVPYRGPVGDLSRCLVTSLTAS